MPEVRVLSIFTIQSHKSLMILVILSVSAAAQAITFFIRGHLQRCEDEQDCPLLLRHVLSGTPRDDELVPALFSRSGGNVAKDKLAAKDENGKEPQQERLTYFRRGTTVWYLSKAAGGPCPFARNGISLRDFSNVSAFAGPESRKRDGQNEFCRGLKRKREREGLRRRPGRSSTNDSDQEDEEEEEEGRRPLKVKLTLRLRPPSCPSTTREQDEDGALSSDLTSDSGSSSSDSDSDSDSEDEVMSVDEGPPLENPEFRKEDPVEESTWSLPPYPIQRRISIPPYTPCEETYSYYRPPLYSFSYPSQTYFPTTSRPKPSIATPSCSDYRRVPSVPLSVASPPPDSDAEDEQFRFSNSPSGDVEENEIGSSVAVKSEEDAQVWPRDVSCKATVKSEPSDDSHFSQFGPIGDVNVKLEDLALDSLSLAWNGSSTDLAAEARLSVDLGVKQEEDESHQDSAGLAWEQSEPVMISPSIEFDMCPLKSHAFAGEQDHGSALLWTDVELLGPENVQPEEFEEDEWTNTNSCTGHQQPNSFMSALAGHSTRTCSHSTTLDPMPSDTVIDAQTHCNTSESIVSLAIFPTTPSPSLSGSVQTWSSPELERASLEPVSPFYGPDLPSFPSLGRHEESVAADAVSEREELAMLATSRQDLGVGRMADGDAQSDISCTGTSKQSGWTRTGPLDLPVVESSAPWERGMISLYDFDEHLLPSAPSFDMPVSKILPLNQVRAEDSAVKKLEPLSPQEEEVFQAFLQCPVWEYNGNSPGPDSPMRTQRQRSVVRDKNSLKENCAIVETVVACAGGDENVVGRKERTPPRPLRRSLRVAKAAATRTVKERLRKRTTAP